MYPLLPVSGGCPLDISNPPHPMGVPGYNTSNRPSLLLVSGPAVVDASLVRSMLKYPEPPPPV